MRKCSAGLVSLSAIVLLIGVGVPETWAAKKKKNRKKKEAAGETCPAEDLFGSLSPRTRARLAAIWDRVETQAREDEEARADAAAAAYSEQLRGLEARRRSQAPHSVDNWDRMSNEVRLEYLKGEKKLPGTRLVKVERTRDRRLKRFAREMETYLLDNSHLDPGYDLVGAPEAAGDGPTLLVTRDGRILGGYVYLVHDSELGDDPEHTARWWVDGGFDAEGEFIGGSGVQAGESLSWNTY